MKQLTKINLIMLALFSILLMAGCGKNNFEGSWVGYNDSKTMYRLNIQENGESYLITQDAYTYKPEKDYPKPRAHIFSAFNASDQPQNVTYDINFILTKQKSELSSTIANLNKDKNQLIVGQNVGNIHFIEKNNTLLFNGIRFKKEGSQDLTDGILKQMQLAMTQELKEMYHQYGERTLSTTYDKVTLGKITFNDSILTNSK